MNTITANECQISAAALLSIARFNDRVAQTKEREGGSGRDNRQAAQALRLVAAEIGLPARGQRRAGNDNAYRDSLRARSTPNEMMRDNNAAAVSKIYGKPRTVRQAAGFQGARAA